MPVWSWRACYEGVGNLAESVGRFHLPFPTVPLPLSLFILLKEARLSNVAEGLLL